MFFTLILADECLAALRVEWLKARAHKLRFEEQVALLEEEKWCTLVSLERYAEEWDSRSELVASIMYECCMVQEGAVAYAKRKARLYRNLGARFQTL
ncbi:hypothetical protein K474DRAFT_1610193 [Panus rudis PR-1116 ss-1]|nr:hypothetical protein K474DRAFT_1610193 [Panus rudis PR-1116 ss-1]